MKSSLSVEWEAAGRRSWYPLGQPVSSSRLIDEILKIFRDSTQTQRAMIEDRRSLAPVTVDPLESSTGQTPPGAA
jgi:hypothetical protein